MKSRHNLLSSGGEEIPSSNPDPGLEGDQARLSVLDAIAEHDPGPNFLLRTTTLQLEILGRRAVVQIRMLSQKGAATRWGSNVQEKGKVDFVSDHGAVRTLLQNHLATFIFTIHGTAALSHLGFQSVSTQCRRHLRFRL